MPDLRRQDAAAAAASTVWADGIAYVLPLAAALPAIQGARVCHDAGRFPRLGRLDEPRDVS